MKSPACQSCKISFSEPLTVQGFCPFCAPAYAAGLDAARDAVAALRISPSQGVYEQAQADFRDFALAAIDALRGESDD